MREGEHARRRGGAIARNERALALTKANSPTPPPTYRPSPNLPRRGYDLDLSCYFPGYYFKKVEERAKGLGLTSEILDRTKTNLKHISVAFSGLFITHQPSYILAAGIYLALKHQAGKQASGGAPNNSHVATMEAIARKLGLELR